MAVPVVGQAGFDEEELAGEAQVVADRAGEALGLAPGVVEGLPDGDAGKATLCCDSFRGRLR